MRPETVSFRIHLRWIIGITIGFFWSERASAQSDTFERDIRPLLQAKCTKCHGAEAHESDVNFASISDQRAALRQRRIWRKAINQIGTGSMPPAEATPLSPIERTRLLEWMQQTVDVVDCNDPANRDPGPSLIRRLSLAEYNHTIRDLMGFEFDAGATVGMTEELADGNIFGNNATALDIPPALMEKYFAAADQILDRLYGTELSSSVDGQIEERARSSREQLFGLKPGEWRKADYQVSPPAGITPREAARRLIAPFIRRAYRGQVVDADLDRLLALFDQSSAQGKPFGESVRWMLKAVLVSPKFLYRIELVQVAEASQPKIAPVSDHQLAVRLSYFLWSSLPDEELLDLADRGRLSAEGPSTEPVKFSGTVISAPSSESHQGNDRNNVFDGDLTTILDGPDANSHWIGLDLKESRPISRIRFAARIGYESRMIGGMIEAADDLDFAKNHIPLLEVKQVPDRGWVTVDFPVPVSRRYVRYVPPKNSYGNIADLEVRGLADGTVLEQQIRRMLTDRRASALTDNFAVRWLQLNKLPTARPSTEFFPEFNPNVRQAMFDETWQFFDGLRRDDRSLLQLLDADYTYVNEELARYYGLSDVTGKELRRVTLADDRHRGGLLGMGSILSLTSHTSRTSPTLRGKWILDVVFGSPPPPPPANVSQIKEDPATGREIKTFREKLAQHAHSAACAACHRKMDPLGLALDNFDAVGRWRDKAGDQPLDVSGELPTGEKLNGIGDLKSVIQTRKDDFLRNLTEQMLGYALGRELDFYDDCPVQEITTQLKADNRFSTLVTGIVKSYPFQHRKNVLSE